MAQRSGLTRGDRRRNRRIEALRAVVRPDRAVLSIDLGEDKQVAVLIDHDCRVLGRRVVKAKAHRLGGLLVWAGELAGRQGFSGVVVACEPTGHRWRSVTDRPWPYPLVIVTSTGRPTLVTSRRSTAPGPARCAATSTPAARVPAANWR